MAKDSREHHSDEFGKTTSGAIGGFDPPMRGAPSTVLIDGIVERESGVTPSPWSLSIQGIAVFLAAMLLFGLALAGIGLWVRKGMPDEHELSAPPQRVTTYDPAWGE